MKRNYLLLALTIGLSASVLLPAEQAPKSRPAVLVELFTSEGCSSCPPADRLLESLEKSEPGSGVDAIVLSEHVDYWNHDGWVDPYSSSKWSDRQSTYVSRFGVNSVYTPEMVVDGATEFVGSDKGRALSAIAAAAKAPKAEVSLTLTSDSKVQIDVSSLPAAAKGPADVYLAVARNEASSQVSAGENGGRRLHHVAVIRSLQLVGTCKPGEPFQRATSFSPGKDIDPNQLRLIAFVQERNQGRVLGAAMRSMQ
jgi:hypothetical protein